MCNTAMIGYRPLRADEQPLMCIVYTSLILVGILIFYRIRCSLFQADFDGFHLVLRFGLNTKTEQLWHSGSLPKDIRERLVVIAVVLAIRPVVEVYFIVIR